MKIQELNENIYEPELDMTGRKMSDVRKPIISLRVLNRLRKMREAKKSETLKAQSTLEIMYGTTDE